MRPRRVFRPSVCPPLAPLLPSAPDKTLDDNVFISKLSGDNMSVSLIPSVCGDDSAQTFYKKTVGSIREGTPEVLNDVSDHEVILRGSRASKCILINVNDSTVEEKLIRPNMSNLNVDV